ncbi:MAG: MFS transporter [Chitinophagaceae bacterium]
MGPKYRSIFSTALWVASLGYFVDIYDLLLFGIIRIPSLKGIGLSKSAIDSYGLLLINVQMIGMLMGGILWGIWGDKKGRLSVLFGSIFLYSVANIANGCIHGTTGYLICRLLSGLGLAGELGAGITLVSEILPAETRGLGTMMVATIGVSGAIAAGLVSKIFDWRICYFIGGGLGICLLLLRIGVMESALFKSLKNKDYPKGNFWMLFNNKYRFLKYLKCLLIGLPTWYIVGILITFSNTFAEKMRVRGPISPANAIIFCYVGITAGDFMSGMISQWWKSRRKVMLLFLGLSSGFVLAYFSLHGVTPGLFYGCCTALGFGAGFWTIFVTVAAESFGTNLRATVATTTPNFARGMLPLVSILFEFLHRKFTYLQSGWMVGVICLGISFWATFGLEETFGKNLDYLER